MESAVLHNLRDGFGVVFVLGAPGAGKGTISAHLSHKYDMMHYSVGDSLRDWMRENRTTPLAARIKHRLDNQGFLPFEDLMPFLCQAITDAINHDTPRYSGIIIDGFPRCADQLRSFDAWLSQSDVPLATNNVSHMRMKAKPDVVLSLEVTKHNAKSRYLSRGRENNDSEEKFQNRFAEYERETVTVEEMYRKRGISITVDMNGTKEENVAILTKRLEESEVWHNMINERDRGHSVVQGIWPMEG